MSDPYSLWRTNKLVLTAANWCVNENLNFWRNANINPRCYWRHLLPKLWKRKLCLHFNQSELWKVFTNAKSAKTVVTWLIFNWRNKNRQKLHTVKMIHIALPERRFEATKTKSRPLATKISPPIPISYTRTRTKKDKNHSVNDTIVSSLCWLIQLIKFLFESHTISIYSSAVWLSVSNGGIQWSLDFGTDSVVLTVKDLVQKEDNELPRKSSASLELVVSKKRIFGQSFSSNPNHSQPRRNAKKEGGGSL